MSPKLAEDLASRGAPPANDTASLSADLLWGVEAISTEIGKSVRQTFHLVATGAIPTAKIGGRIVASRTRLRAHFQSLLSA